MLSGINWPSRCLFMTALKSSENLWEILWSFDHFIWFQYSPNPNILSIEQTPAVNPCLSEPEEWASQILPDMLWWDGLIASEQLRAGIDRNISVRLSNWVSKSKDRNVYDISKREDHLIFIQRYCVPVSCIFQIVFYKQSDPKINFYYLPKGFKSKNERQENSNSSQPL